MNTKLAQLILQVNQMIKDKEYALYLAEKAQSQKKEELAFVKGALDGLNTLNQMETTDEQQRDTPAPAQ